MKLNKYEIKAYVTRELHQRVAEEALIRNMTMSRIIREELNEYFSLREELANAIVIPGDLGENHTGKIIHTLLAHTEERFDLRINKLEKQVLVVDNQLKLLINMLLTSALFH